MDRVCWKLESVRFHRLDPVCPRLDWVWYMPDPICYRLKLIYWNLDPIYYHQTLPPYPRFRGRLHRKNRLLGLRQQKDVLQKTSLPELRSLAKLLHKCLLCSEKFREKLPPVR